MKVLGKLRPGAQVDLMWPAAPEAGEDRSCAVRVIDCKNGQVTLGFDGPVVVDLAKASESDPTPPAA
jgi:hypothetical protein